MPSTLLVHSREFNSVGSWYMKIIYANTPELLADCFADILDEKRIAVDIETTGLDPMTGDILLLQLCAGDGEPTYVIPVQKVDQTYLQGILKLLETKICLIHNAVFEYKWLKVHYGINLETVYDSKIVEALLTAGLDKYRTGLADTASRHLGINLEKEIRMTFVGQNPKEFEPTEEQIKYAANDVIWLHQLRESQLKELIKEDLMKVAVLEMAAMPVFARMELAGMVLDVECHKLVLDGYREIAERAGKEAHEALNPYWKMAEEQQLKVAEENYAILTAKINKYLDQIGGRLTKDAPEDIRVEVETLRKVRKKPKAPHDLVLTSRQQVMAALEKSGINLPDMKAETVREAVPDAPILKSYAEWQHAQKIVSTYGQNLVDKISPVTGRLHSEYNQIVSTGRTSSHGPNFQNIPKDIRACFKPAPGYKFVVADFKAMELRIAAGMSGDPVMLKAFEEGIDLHSYTAFVAWPGRYQSWENVDPDGHDRSAAKTANFAVIYGGSAEALYYRNLIDDMDTARLVVSAIQRAYPTLWKWIHKVGDMSLSMGHALTALGRKRYFEVLPRQPIEEEKRNEWFRLKSRIVRQAMNHPVQGTGADIAKRAMIMIDKQLPEGAKIVAMVHDEIVTEVPENKVEDVSKVVEVAMLMAGAELISGVDIPADVHVKDKWTKSK